MVSKSDKVVVELVEILEVAVVKVDREKESQVMY
jgi:hypothetical protein